MTDKEAGNSKKGVKKVGYSELIKQIETADSMAALKNIIFSYKQEGKLDKSVERAIFIKTVEIVGD